MLINERQREKKESLLGSFVEFRTLLVLLGFCRKDPLVRLQCWSHDVELDIRPSVRLVFLLEKEDDYLNAAFHLRF